MKTSFLRIMIIICAVASTLWAQAQRSVDFINDNDRLLVDSAMYLMDTGKARDAIGILDNLCNKYKNNYALEYERLYAYYLAGDFKRIVKEGPKLYKHPESEPQLYQLVGNAQDVLGDPEAAVNSWEHPPPWQI